MLALYIMTGWYTVGRFQTIGSRDYMVGAGEGMVGLAISDPDWIQGTDMLFEKHDARWRWWFIIARTPKSSQFFVPIWLPLIAAVAVSWYTRPKRISDACCPSCGYALEGLTSTTCPECGTTITYA